MNIKLELVKTKEDYQKILNIRRKVFIEEQNVSEDIEIEYEDESFHVLASNDNEPVGTGRWRKTDFGFKLERFAVLEHLRGKGIGKQLVLFILNQLSDDNMIYLHAQEDVIKFYENLGFVIIGDKFLEADIVHAKMIYKKKNKKSI
ncbi:MAG: GNAT family N-acetyltransferase [Candidatus Neomarinimicrobiota bacterium]|nr:GNAT family N-acetyltransferase [Candidatus Neomarinimicrobiota bacterium]